MAVKIRLRRMGAKKAPFYRIVVADSRYPRDGRNLEEIGYYNPLTEPSEIKINLERANYWISVGAQPSDTVRSLMKRAGESGYVAPGQKAAPVDRTKLRAPKAVKIEDAGEEAAPAPAEAAEAPAEAAVEAPAEAAAEAPAAEAEAAE